MIIKTKQDVVKVDQRIKEIVSNYIDSRLVLKLEIWLAPNHKRRVMRCSSCSGFIEYIDEHESPVSRPHDKNCNLASLGAEQQRQLNAVANPAELLNRSHDITELMAYIPPGEKASMELDGILQSLYDSLEGASEKGESKNEKSI